MCFTYEPEQEKDECCGASGRKLRQVCIYCPNFSRYWERRQAEDRKEGKGNEKGH